MWEMSKKCPKKSLKNVEKYVVLYICVCLCSVGNGQNVENEVCDMYVTCLEQLAKKSKNGQ